MEPTVVEAGARDADELVDLVEERGHVVVRTAFMGEDREVVLRYDGETFYCDTPTRLHRHGSAAEMRECVRKQGYAAD